MADAIIELAGPEDLPVISKIYNQIFRPSRDVESFHRRFQVPHRVRIQAFPVVSPAKRIINSRIPGRKLLGLLRVA